MDRSQSIRNSVNDVQVTLLIASGLVIGVIFVFLRTISATFIPSIALPITIVGTFAGMSAMGYSLDNLSLMALTLCVGFVVDDAIVMLENIMRHIEAGVGPLEGSLLCLKGKVVTPSFLMAGPFPVFLPVVFI